MPHGQQGYPNFGGASPYNPRGIGGYATPDPSAEAAYSRMPYDQIVDAMRGGADLFSGPTRELTKAEKLQAAIGAMTAFFGRMGTIGAPPATKLQLGEAAEEGMRQYQAAVSAPQRELQQAAFMQAAQARAQMEQQEMQQRQQAQDFSQRMRSAEFGAQIAPGLQPRAMPMPQGQAGPPQSEGIPEGALAQAMASGDFSSLMPFYQPRAAAEAKDERNYQQQLGLERERASLQSRDPLRLAQAEDYRARSVERAENTKKQAALVKSAKAELAGIEKQNKDNPAGLVKDLAIWAEKHAGVDFPDEVIQHAETLRAIAERKAKGSQVQPSSAFRLQPMP